jgi:GNAT superfamily N-acetyltransferase
MVEVRIRSARVGDAPVLARLRCEFKCEDEERAVPDRDGFVVECTRWLRDRLAGGRWVAWVAECDGVVRGHVFLQRVEKIPTPFPDRTELGYVTNFYVQPGYRGHGLGRALLDAVTEHARDHLVDTMVVWPAERSAALYRRAGYTTPTELLELALTDEA